MVYGTCISGEHVRVEPVRRDTFDPTTYVPGKKGLLCCPVCHEAVTQKAVRTMVVPRDGRGPRSYDSPFDFTSGGVVVVFVCENGCEWDMVFSCHDGTMCHGVAAVRKPEHRKAQECAAQRSFEYRAPGSHEGEIILPADGWVFAQRGDDLAGPEYMQCPICGEALGLHAVSAELVPTAGMGASREYGVPFDFESGGAVVRFKCESGCSWQLVYSGHAGETYRAVVIDAIDRDIMRGLTYSDSIIRQYKPATKKQYYACKRIGSRTGIETPWQKMGLDDDYDMAFYRWGSGVRPEYSYPWVSIVEAGAFIFAHRAEADAASLAAKDNEVEAFAVYKHTSPSGHSYVGITQLENPSDRWQGGFGYVAQPFYSAITKYGWSEFTHWVLDADGETWLEYKPGMRAHRFTARRAYLLEREHIQREGDYNASKGGEGCL